MIFWVNEAPAQTDRMPAQGTTGYETSDVTTVVGTLSYNGLS